MIALRLLIDSGGNVNAVNATEGASVLHWACIAGNVRAVHLLRQRGADLHHADKRGYNALLHAQRSLAQSQAEIKHIILLSDGLTAPPPDDATAKPAE